MRLGKIAALSFALFAISSCKKDLKNRWDVQIAQPVAEVKIVDISKDFFDTHIPMETFKKNYPWFQGTNSDEAYIKRRSDAEEKKIYENAISKVNVAQLRKDLSEFFSMIKYYIPGFKVPQVFIYSSSLDGIDDPIFFRADANMLFVDISAFMGSNSPYYKPVENYLKNTMNPENIIPKVSEIFAENIVPPVMSNQKFLDRMIYEGKIMIVQDALLPETADEKKINYTQKQLAWAEANEANIWNYFVENNILYSDDARLEDRFILPAPFSKFYTEIDRESSPQAGVFIGWQICRKYLEEQPDVELLDFLKKPTADVFQQSAYKPK